MTQLLMRESKVGLCSKCGKPADWNTPMLTKQGQLLCANCSRNYPELLMGISQFLWGVNYLPDYCGTWAKGEAVIHTEGKLTCWIRGGSRCWPLTKQEMDDLIWGKITVEAFLDNIIKASQEGKGRCSDCGMEIAKEELKHTNFAGSACPRCYVKFTKQVDGERKGGNCCLLCGQPRSICTC